MTLTVTPVAAEDRATVEQLYCAMYAFLGEPVPPADWLQNVLSQALCGQRHLWLARLGAEAVGFVDFKLFGYHPGSASKFCRIFDLFVAASAQRRGHGRELARRVLAAAAAKGADSVELNVLPQNQAAQAFWQSVGFELHLFTYRQPLEPPTPAA